MVYLRTVSRERTEMLKFIEETIGTGYVRIFRVIRPLGALRIVGWK